MNQDLFPHPWKSPLARQLIVAMVLFSASITLIVTAVQLYRDYQHEVRGLDKQFEKIGKVHIPSLAQSLWSASNKDVLLQLEGIMREPNIVYAAVDEKNRGHTEASSRTATRMVERRYVLRYEHRGKSQEIGILTVRATLDNLYAQLMNDAVQVLLDNMIRTLLVGLFVFALFYRLITRHLTAVARFLHGTDLAESTSVLMLDRTASTTPDELDFLVASVNNMQTRTRAALEAQQDSERQVRMLLDYTSEAIYGVDLQGMCTFANPACLSMLGYASESDLIGRRMYNLIHPAQTEGPPRPVEEGVVQRAPLAGEACHGSDEMHRRADGTLFPVEYWSRPMYRDGELVGAVVTFIDISQRKETEEVLHRLAYYDNLTGLPNRALFSDRLHQALNNMKRRQKLMALMVLDLDRFKVVNDTMGHEAGDILLQEVASRLKGCIRTSDTCSRLGGDEFALIFPDMGEIQDVAQLAQKVLRQFTEPVVIGGREVFSSVSIGIALFPSDTEDADALMKFADSAMYHAKELGRDTYQFYSSEMTASVHAQLQLETNLRRAIENREFVLHYQSQIDVHCDRPCGVEALLRWRDHAGNLIPPAQFIPLAEDTGLIVPIGKWVLETACLQLKRWHDSGLEDLTLSVNVAARQFRDATFIDAVSEAIAAAKIPPHSLELEITESILLEHSDDTLRTLNALKGLGVKLAIDDFGTGYSSLSYLKRFPIDRVKIDQSFVRDLAVDNDDLAIVRAIIALAQALRLTVIAEGVETEEQLVLLLREGCHECQGYLFSRPMEAGSISASLHQLIRAA